MSQGLPCTILTARGYAGQPRPLVPVTGDSRLLREEGLGHPIRWAVASHGRGERGWQGARRATRPRGSLVFWRPAVVEGLGLGPLTLLLSISPGRGRNGQLRGPAPLGRCGIRGAWEWRLR